MLYVFRTATAGQKALMEALTRDTGVIRKLNEPGLFGANSFGFSGKVLAAIKDAGIVVEKYRVWPLWLFFLIFPAILALVAFEVIGFGVAFVLWMAAMPCICYGWYLATAKMRAVGLCVMTVSGGTGNDLFEWASDSCSADNDSRDPYDFTSRYFDHNLYNHD